ncbi:MAG TPA: hypothetical protein VFD48_00020 [Pyrinomonadaceae bacterium]|nr:hypothetical protein [Pyrinomonadaceae bacterium]
MRILEVLKILEAATIECKDARRRHARVERSARRSRSLLPAGMEISGFREHLKPVEEFGPGGEGQQQNLRVYFGGIHDS